MKPKSVRELTHKLNRKWWEQVGRATIAADEIIEEKRDYDAIPWWEQVSWPHGQLGLITQRASRVKCTVEKFTTGKDLLALPKDVHRLVEDLVDLINYSRFFLATLRVLLDEEELT